MEPVERDEAAKKDASIAIEIVVLYFSLHKLSIKTSYYRSNAVLPCTFIQTNVDKSMT